MNSKLACFLFLFASYGEYNRILRSTDTTLKYEIAKKCFDSGKYGQAVVLLEKAIPLTKGSVHEEEFLYLLAQSYYAKKDYVSAVRCFKDYYTSFPGGEHAESACFHSAYGLYLESPDARFDQSDTYEAIRRLQGFLEYYPCSREKERAEDALSELKEKLAFKELIAVRLYYNLGNHVLLYSFPGGNYRSCVITAQNALQSYPFSKYREDFMYYIFMATYEMALQSIKKKKDFQYCDIANEYYSYINEYPSGKYLKKIQKSYDRAKCLSIE